MVWRVNWNYVKILGIFFGGWVVIVCVKGFEVVGECIGWRWVFDVF